MLTTPPLPKKQPFRIGSFKGRLFPTEKSTGQPTALMALPQLPWAIKFETVLQLKKRNINQKNKNKPLECLALETLFTKEKNYYTSIFFAGDGIITIISEAIDVSLKDIGEPWKVKSSPVHKI